MNRDNRWYRFVFVLAALLLVGCDDGLSRGTLVFDGQHRFTAATPLPGDLLLRAGTAEFTRDSQVGGTIYVVGGRLLLDGVVAGDLVVIRWPGHHGANGRDWRRFALQWRDGGPG